MTQLPTLNQAQQAVKELVERFARNLEQYRRPEYNEANVRHEFIEPFFEALGWDVHNRAGYSEVYKDVTYEESLRVAAGIEAPDYAFRIGGIRKFFVEAKKPAIHVKDDAGPAYQLRRYAWSAHLPLSILTDFQELAVYECTRRPERGDKAGVGRSAYYTFEQYPDRLSEIWDVFAKESVLRGSFDRYAEGAKGKRGTSQVDDELLKEIEGWRDALARNLALRNPGLSVHELNFAVQATIDRVVFLRVAEDRGIEEYGRLQALLNGANTYGRLQDLYRQADERYNAGLFDFKADGLSLTLQVDDKVLKDVFARLYFPDSPYEFSVLPVEILGQVYEQFLGKVIRLTAGHQAKVEEKPEVKKAGGVYYTPSYIVDYIVKHTLGELVEGKSPAEIAGGRFLVASNQLPVGKRTARAAGGRRLVTENRQPETGDFPLRILDPACGSGSFLLGAYQYLLDHCLNWYSAHEPEKWAASRQPPIHRHGPAGGWRLTTAERKRILLTHIYGVDIDRQAVEVTKLSLLLKVLEGESQETLGQQLALWRERALPNLDRNIQCGNSLIGPDYREGRLMQDADEARRVNAFDWQRAFPDAMASGGFDAVIGNPPYIRIQTMKEWAPEQADFFSEHYVSASQGNYDIYVVFVEKGLRLLTSRGRLGLILPSKFFSTDYGASLRKLISERRALSEVVDFGHAQVFASATTYTCLLFLTGSPGAALAYANVTDPPVLAGSQPSYQIISASALTGQPWVFGTDRDRQVVDRTLRNALPLGHLPARIGRGSSSGADDVFILRREGMQLLTRDGVEVHVEPGILRTPVYATDFGRYFFRPRSQGCILFPYEVSKAGYELIDEARLRAHFPKTYAYLASRRKHLEARKQSRRWYGFSAPRNLNVHESAQILVPLLANHGSFCRLPKTTSDYCLMASGGFSITVEPQNRLSPDYVLGVLNSRLLFWRLRSISNKFRGGWITCTKQYVETLPIRTINFSDPADVARHDRMVALVERMLELHKRQAEARTPADRELYARQIEATDREIDALVYELYGLTEEEIAVVEEVVNG